MSESLVLLGLIFIAASGVPGLVLAAHSTTGQRLAAVLVVAGSALGIAGTGAFWWGESQPIVLPWLVPGGEFAVEVDGISAVFLLPIFLIAMLGSLYGLDYWKQTEHPRNGRKLRLFYGFLAAGMTLLVIARNSVLFLTGWEVMALSAFVLVATEDHDKDVRETSWLFLATAHAGALVLFALFGVLHAVSGSFALDPLNAESLTPGMASAIFGLALVGFGLKAGIMPLHFWLPSSHAIAPSHVSAIMSGVIIKMGIYGIIRVTSLIPNPPVHWGVILLVLGVVSGVLGVVFAIAQHDIKRLLAYHSIENIGIIVMGIGLALLGRALARPDWLILGLAGSLLHTWNHAFFKALLFLSAGSVIHQVHTREIDRLGGLGKAMPWTAGCFLVGAIAICGLPPLNGFVSEFLIYLALFRTLGMGGEPSYAAAAFAAPALALVGALAIACFVKVFGAVFLGESRSEPASHAHESGLAMIAPMGVLAICCFAIGLAPGCLVSILSKGVWAWAPELRNVEAQFLLLAPMAWISWMGLLLIGTLLFLGVVLRRRLEGRAVRAGPTWDCGYAVPSARMQYSSSSFAAMLVSLFGWVLRPQTHRPRDLPLFPPRTEFHSHVPDPVLDKAILPLCTFGGWVFSWLRLIQHGSIQTYLFYLLLALLALLLWR